MTPGSYNIHENKIQVIINCCVHNCINSTVSLFIYKKGFSWKKYASENADECNNSVATFSVFLKPRKLLFCALSFIRGKICYKIHLRLSAALKTCQLICRERQIIGLGPSFLWEPVICCWCSQISLSIGHQSYLGRRGVSNSTIRITSFGKIKTVARFEIIFLPFSDSDCYGLALSVFNKFLQFFFSSPQIYFLLILYPWRIIILLCTNVVDSELIDSLIRE